MRGWNDGNVNKRDARGTNEWQPVLDLFRSRPAAVNVPDVNWFAEQLCELRNVWCETLEENWLETDENHPDEWIAKELHRALIAYIAAAPSPSAGK
jgi:hypothetical protein